LCVGARASANCPPLVNAIARHIGVTLYNDDWDRVGYESPRSDIPEPPTIVNGTVAARITTSRWIGMTTSSSGCAAAREVHSPDRHPALGDRRGAMAVYGENPNDRDRTRKTGFFCCHSDIKGLSRLSQPCRNHAATPR
jgi:hypothetical protein